jgi:uncharacterized protein (UPF0218 family)
MLTLPEEHRKLFKEPFGKLHQSIEEIIPLISSGIVYTVGDVVTHNLQRNGITPAIAVIDGHTMRSPCSRKVALRGECINVKNPAGTLTDELIRALTYAVLHPPVTINVDGEEDLSVIPLILAAPPSAIVLYGQPHKGVVMLTVNREAQQTAQHFLDHFIRTDA